MKTLGILGILSAVACHVLSQGAFRNLDFEESTVPYLSNQVGYAVPASDAFPGWQVYRQGVIQTQVYYNLPPPQSGVALFASPLYTPQARGRFGALFWSDPSAETSLAQVGTIPLLANWLLFEMEGRDSSASEALILQFAGNPLPTQRLDAGTYPKLWGAEVSAFRGRTGELRLAAGRGLDGGGVAVLLEGLTFDVVPEPNAGALSAIAAVALAAIGVKRRRHICGPTHPEGMSTRRRL